MLHTSRMNDSDIFFLSDKMDTPDLAIKLKNQDIMREAGTKLKVVLLNVDFGLQGNCIDLKASWETAMMPSP